MLFRRARGLSLGAGLTPSSSLFVSCGRRLLHTPPGGFEEPLPPNFGRQQGKGELSHTNLRKKRQKRRLLQQQKQRLPLDALRDRGHSVSLAKVKRELLALGKRSEDALKGPAQPTIRVLAALPEDTADVRGGDGSETGSPAAVEGSHAYSHRRAATRVAHDVVSQVAREEADEDGTGMGSQVDDMSAYHEATGTANHTAGTLLDRAASAHASATAHSAAFALAPHDDTSNEAHLSAEVSHTAPDRTADGLIASAVESHWRDQRDADEAADAAAVAMERRFAVSPRSTVLGSDLDRLEHDMLREHHQRMQEAPPLDDVYAQFGSGRRGKRMQWAPSSSFERLNAADFTANRASESALGDTENRNLSPYYMYAEAYQETLHDDRRAQWKQQQRAAREAGKGIDHTRRRENSDQPREELGTGVEEGVQPAEANPHFPIETAEEETAPRAVDTSAFEFDADGIGGSRDRIIEVDARRDYKPRLVVPHTTPAAPPARTRDNTTHGDGEEMMEDDGGVVYDAYRQRRADNRLVELRGADYWDDYAHRHAVEVRGALRREAFELEKRQEGAMDTSEVEYSVNKVRKETFLYFQAHPINEMIQESYVRIRRVLPKGGAEGIYYDPFDPYEGEVDLTAPEGRTPSPTTPQLGDTEGNVDASALQTRGDTALRFHMDTDIPIQDARRMAQELGLDLIRIGAIHSQKSDRRITALCMLGDHREHMRDMIKFKIQKLGVQPPPTRECIEVPFTGGIHPHAIRFKAVGIAKHLLHRHAIRLNLTKFGSPREGFPVFQSILDEVKRQCLRLKAYHKAGEIQATYTEIFCYLYPSTGRSPKTTVDHPTAAQVRAVQDFRVLENEKEIYFDDLREKGTRREQLAYLTKLEKGTAWAEKDEGMSLQRQRAIKVMLGYLPKGNSELYAARGDVNIPAPFRSSHPTSVSSWSSPQESNLEQASRGAATLGKRAGMSISDMHDLGETPENPTQLDRFYYRVQGPALEVGEFKEALGLKDNRRKKPPLAPGFATLGMKNGGSSEQPQWEATK